MEKLDNIGLNGLVFTEGLVQHTPIVIGWLTCVQQVLRPHSLCRLGDSEAHANRQMPIVSVVRRLCRNERKNEFFGDNLQIKNTLDWAIS